MIATQNHSQAKMLFLLDFLCDNLMHPCNTPAVVIAMIIMLVAADPVGNFVNNHPTVKMLALSFLLLVGVALVADGLHFHIPRGYLYFAIAFSALVEALNLIAARRRQRFRLKASGEIVDELAVKT